MKIVIFAEIQINLSCFVLSFRQKLDGYFRRISALKALTKKKDVSICYTFGLFLPHKPTGSIHTLYSARKQYNE